mmetsp:Transcript_42299/g.130449  ORF Transcript_42299/g.130449 Transcript_42299/m.130449 type:complete len:290 (+) Transcript_42299:451-1320(+)
MRTSSKSAVWLWRVVSERRRTSLHPSGRRRRSQTSLFLSGLAEAWSGSSSGSACCPTRSTGTCSGCGHKSSATTSVLGGGPSTWQREGRSTSPHRLTSVLSPGTRTRLGEDRPRRITRPVWLTMRCGANASSDGCATPVMSSMRVSVVPETSSHMESEMLMLHASSACTLTSVKGGSSLGLSLPRTWKRHGSQSGSHATKRGLCRCICAHALQATTSLASLPAHDATTDVSVSAASGSARPCRSLIATTRRLSSSADTASCTPAAAPRDRVAAAESGGVAGPTLRSTST